MTSVIYSLDDADFMLFGGDFNAKIGDRKDFIEDIDIIKDREVIDDKVNKHGESLLEFLKGNKLCVLNGRLSGKNDYTYVTPQGKSVVDYFITPIECLQYCTKMNIRRVRELLDEINVIPKSAIPDHSMLVLDIDLSDFLILTAENDITPNKEVGLPAYSKKHKLSNIPNDFMESVDVTNELCEYIRYISSGEPTQNAVDEIYDRFVRVHYNEMDKKLPKLGKGKPGNRNRNKRDFWNDSLEYLFKETVKAEKEFCNYRHKDDKRTDLRSEYKDKQRTFDMAYRKAKRASMRQKEIEIENMVGKQGKEMWKSLDKIGPQINSKGMQIPEEVVYNGQINRERDKILGKWEADFRTLYQISDQGGYIDIDLNVNGIKLNEINLNILNSPVRKEEVVSMVKHARKNKAISVDLIPNEVIKNVNSIEMLYEVYNCCFKNNIIPNIWRKSLIQPVYKGKHLSKVEPLNYRPISLICNPCKGFSYILNKRLLDVVESNKLLVEEQNGFRRGRSCMDHVFVLTSIINSRIMEKKSTFCCFVDFSKAFDSINRNLLINTLRKCGIEGNFIDIIQTMYRKTQSAVKVNHMVTNWFDTKAGVRQGQNDSPTLFALFINQLAIRIKKLNKGIKYGDNEISILLYADDIVIIAETEEALQCMLNELDMWCKHWQMNINRDKTQVIHFRPKRKKQTNFLFRIGNLKLDIVSKYKYLGCQMDEHLCLNTSGNSLAEASGRALGKLLGKYYNNKGLGYKTYTTLYETCICPIMEYCSGVWGYNRNDNINKIYNRAIRSFLGVNKYAPIAGMEGDMGWTPPIVRRKLEILRLWNRIVGLEDDRLPRQIYNTMNKRNEMWVQNVKEIFKSINCLTAFENNCKIVNLKAFINFAKETLMSHYSTSWKLTVENKPKLTIYRKIKEMFNPETYCKTNLTRSQRSFIARLRLGVLPINVEVGRYNATPREQRLCTICKNKEVEDEMHILFYCPAYNDKREMLVNHASQLIVNFDKLDQMDQIHSLTTHPNLVRKTCHFIKEAMTLRQENMRVIL
jgi:hypothetical protein